VHAQLGFIASPVARCIGERAAEFGPGGVGSWQWAVCASFTCIYWSRPGRWDLTAASEVVGGATHPAHAVWDLPRWPARAGWLLLSARIPWVCKPSLISTPWRRPADFLRMRWRAESGELKRMHAFRAPRPGSACGERGGVFVRTQRWRLALLPMPGPWEVHGPAGRSARRCCACCAPPPCLDGAARVLGHPRANADLPARPSVMEPGRIGVFLLRNACAPLFGRQPRRYAWPLDV